jgi:hypothetical protein
VNRFHFYLAVAALLAASCASTPHTSVAVGPQQGKAQSMAAPAAVSPPAEAPKNAQVAVAPLHSSLLSAEALGIYRTPEQQQRPPTADELAVIASAKTLLGKPPNANVTINGRAFTLDCIGTVCAAFYGVSLDVAKDFDYYTGDGVNRLYMTLMERNALHNDKYPRPGDVVIWDNTWDVKGDGDRIHDPRTHAGIVMAVDADGTIYYLHENLYKGVVIETMNLLRPADAWDEQGKRMNSGMAIASKPGGPRPEHSLSGDVFDCFGDVLGQKSYFYVDLSRAETVPVPAMGIAYLGDE